MKTKAPKLTPSPQIVKQSKEVDMGKSPTAEFMSLALDMTWKLAVVVLLPIIIGSVLSHKFHSNYYLLGGILLALLLAIVVVYQSYNLANEVESKKGKTK